MDKLLLPRETLQGHKTTTRIVDYFEDEEVRRKMSGEVNKKQMAAIDGYKS